MLRKARSVFLRFRGPGICLLFSLILLPQFAAAQRAEAESRKAADIGRAGEAPTLDGVLNDLAWSDATIIDDLHQYRPLEGADAAHKTRFMITFDDDFLYVGVRAYDSDSSAITARQMVQGGSINQDDNVSIILDPFNSRRTAYRFMLNPLGIRREGTYDTPSEISWDWKGIWDASAVIDGKGWSAEVAIPFKTLSFDPRNGSWGVNFDRRTVRIQERSAWESRNRTTNASTTGVISGFEGLSQGLGLDIVPALVLNRSREFGSGDSESDVEPSLDVFYNITPQLTAALTINTDFSATEVDDQEVNLTRFSLFFPEKREFFLQDAEIFQFGNIEKNGIPFYSRRIGIDSAGQPVNIIGGVKLTGRIGPWSIGVLDVLQDEFEAESLTIAEDNLLVARVSRRVLAESAIGVIVTDGDASTNADNSLVGADFRYRNTRLHGGKVLDGELWFQRSSTEGVSGDESAWGAGIALSNENGFWGGAGVRVFEDSFNPGIGFLNRTGVHEYNLDGGYNRWMNGRRIDRFKSFVNMSYITDTNGRLETREIDWFPVSILNPSGDKFEFIVSNTKEVLSEDFEIVDGVIIPPGEYTFNQVGAEITGASYRQIAPVLKISSGAFYDGHQNNVTLGATWRPNRFLFVDLEAERSDVSLPYGDFQTTVYRGNLDIAFNPQWAWLNVIQYDSVSEEMGINSRLRWIPQSGREAYFVVNHGFVRDDSDEFRSSTSEIVLKVNYTFRF